MDDIDVGGLSDGAIEDIHRMFQKRRATAKDVFDSYGFGKFGMDGGQTDEVLQSIEAGLPKKMIYKMIKLGFDEYMMTVIRHAYVDDYLSMKTIASELLSEKPSGYLELMDKYEGLVDAEQKRWEEEEGFTDLSSSIT